MYTIVKDKALNNSIRENFRHHSSSSYSCSSFSCLLQNFKRITCSRNGNISFQKNLVKWNNERMFLLSGMWNQQWRKESRIHNIQYSDQRAVRLSDKDWWPKINITTFSEDLLNTADKTYMVVFHESRGKFEVNHKWKTY